MIQFHLPQELYIALAEKSLLLLGLLTGNSGFCPDHLLGLEELLERIKVAHLGRGAILLGSSPVSSCWRKLWCCGVSTYLPVYLPTYPLPSSIILYLYLNMLVPLEILLNIFLAGGFCHFHICSIHVCGNCRG